MTEPTLLLVNHWHDDNKGDSAITSGIVTLARDRWPNATIRIATLHEADTPAYASQLRHLGAAHQVAAEPSFAPTEAGSAARGGAAPGSVTNTVRWLARMAPVAARVLAGRPDRRSRERLRDVDLVVLVGGSNIYDNPSVRAPLSLARLLGILYPAWVADRVGVPVVMAGHTLGPFARRVSLPLTRRMLHGVRRAALREATSVPIAQELAITPAEVRPDMAFATAPDHSARVQAILDRTPGTGRALALVVRTHPHAGAAADGQVVRALADSARAALAEGLADRVIVVAHTLGPTPVEDDRAASRALFDAVRDLPAILVEDDLSAEELAGLYGACELVVAVRLHAAILALSQGTPAFAIAYMTRKTEGVMVDAGLPDAWCGYEETTADRVLSGLRLLARPQTREHLAQARESWRSALRAEAHAWPGPR